MDAWLEVIPELRCEVDFDVYGQSEVWIQTGKPALVVQDLREDALG